jgi:uncharacterized protein
MPAQFHLSIPVESIERARAFYVDLIGCTQGRASEQRIDVNFFGHHIVMHLAPDEAVQSVKHFESDGATVSVRHFGAIVDVVQWQALADRLDGKVEFSMAPQTIREGTVEEQRIMMFPDGCGNIVEFKSIPHSRVFATA